MRLGYVVAAPSSSRASYVYCDSYLCEMERRYEKEMHRVEEDRSRSQEYIAALQHDNVEPRSQLAAFRTKLDELVRHMPPNMPPPLASDILVDAYDDDSIDDDDGCPPVINIILYYF